MNALDRAVILGDLEQRAAIYERLTLAIEIAEKHSRDCATTWERELWDHIIKLCGEALGEVGELVDR
jgi:hypothetical protein